MNRFLYEQILRRAMFLLPPEAAHDFAMAWLAALSRSRGLLRLAGRGARGVPVRVMQIDFPNCIGLAAGFDKNAVAIPAWEAMGFGFIEVGTITAKPQPGNDHPRLFRLPEQRAIVNRMGFNNEGAEAVARRLDHLFASSLRPQVPLGINIGKSKSTELVDAPSDYARSMRLLRAFGDYYVINVSSPNTPGLRTLQQSGELAAILDAVRAENCRNRPMVVKIAPDLDDKQIEEVVGLAESAGLAGIIATNTTVDHSSLPDSVRGKGGLSGAPLASRSNDVIRKVRSLTRLAIIGSGGILSARDASDKLQAGSDLLQVYTGLIYRGPALIGEVASLRRP